MTKAKTAAAKLRAKRARGRPCKPDVARNDNGRISRAREGGEAPDVLMRSNRVRMFGVMLSDKQKKEMLVAAGDKEYGTVIGRLLKSEEITDPQYKALQRFGDLAERYRATMCVPDSLKKTSGGSVMRIPDELSEIETREKWKVITRVINEAQFHYSGNLMAALTFIVSRDEFHEHLIGDARVAANALVRHYKIS